MSEMERREALLKQDGYIIGIASLSLLNGMHFSPYFSFVAIGRLTGRQQSDCTSMAVWLGAIFLITLPSLMGLVSGNG